MAADRPTQRMGPQQARIYLSIRTAIEQGHLQPGQRLASQAQLTQEHGAALATVHQALRALERDGYITRRHGVGTFVTNSPPTPATHLRALARFGTQQFPSVEHATSAALQLIAEQIGMRSAFLSRLVGDQLEIVADFDRQGCGIHAGTVFSLDDAF